MFPSIVAFDFYSILGSFFTFWGPNSFWGCWGRVQKLFWGLLIQTNDFCFLSFALFLLYHVVVSLRWVGVGGIPSNYFVSTILQLWLFCCWGYGCYWAVTIIVLCLIQQILQYNTINTIHKSKEDRFQLKKTMHIS